MSIWRSDERGLIGFWSAEKAFRSNPCLSQQKLLSRPAYLPRSRRTGAVVLLKARDRNIGQAERAASAASAARVPQSKGKPRADGHNSL